MKNRLTSGSNSASNVTAGKLFALWLAIEFEEYVHNIAEVVHTMSGRRDRLV